MAWYWAGADSPQSEPQGRKFHCVRCQPPGIPDGPGSFGIAGCVGDVVGHGVGNRGIGVQGLFGGGDADALGQVEDLLSSSVEPDEQLPGDVRGVARRIGSRGSRGRDEDRGQDEHGCGDQLSHGPQCDVNTPWQEKFLVARV